MTFCYNFWAFDKKIYGLRIPDHLFGPLYRAFTQGLANLVNPLLSNLGNCCFAINTIVNCKKKQNAMVQKIWTIRFSWLTLQLAIDFYNYIEGFQRCCLEYKLYLPFFNAFPTFFYHVWPPIDKFKLFMCMNWFMPFHLNLQMILFPWSP